MSIQRYKPVGVNHSSVYLDPAADGEVVMHDDHAAEVAALEARVRELEAGHLAARRYVFASDRENAYQDLLAALAAVDAEGNQP